MDPVPPLALTMGEPAGIGGEIVLKAWSARDAAGVPPFFAIDDPNRLARLAARLNWPVPIRAIDRPAEAVACFTHALPVLPLRLPGKIVPGRPDPAHAPLVLEALERAVALTLAGAAAAIVTNPIHKQSLYAAGFRHPGHTEFLAARTDPGARPVMLLACPGLRVVPATVHIPLAQVARSLSREMLVATGRVLGRALRQDFGIARPRIAMAGLNPHGGEGGALGREEIEIVAPAADDLRADGLAVIGPAPADTLFHAAARRRYDAALCLYHDQALLPLKTIDFWRGVNITLGLAVVRTSPDHGTAFDLAGTGRADARSLIAALKAAAAIAARRRPQDDAAV
jgi:4-hydroxythreonine-4-phosphate dehydrogenase